MRKLDRVRLRSRHAHDPRLGEQRSRQHGHGLDFADFREYLPGDDFRHIDWNIYSRLDRLFVRLFAEEQSLSLELVIDVSRSMRPSDHPDALDDKFSYAQQLAAAIGYVALRSGAQLSIAPLQSASSAVRMHGRRHLARLCAYLAAVEPDGPSDLGVHLKRRAAAGGRPGVCLVISDLLDASDWQAALMTLVGQRKEIHLLHVLTREELQPTEQGQLVLVDAEDARRATLNVDEAALAAYREIADAWLEEIRTFARRHRINYHLLLTARPLEALLLEELRRGGLLT